MKDNKNKNNKLFIIVLAVFVAIGFIASQSERVNSIPLIIGLVILYLGFILYKKGQGKEPNLIRKIKPLQKSVEEFIPINIGEYNLIKGNKNNKIIITGMPDFTKIHKFKKIEFVPEPSNKDDNMAIKDMLGDMLLGYVDKGENRDMIHKWLKKDQPMHAVISEFDEKEKIILYYIGFYGVSK